MNKKQFTQLLGIIYIAGGGALLLFFAAEFIFRLALSIIGLVLIWRGLQLVGINLGSMAMHHYIRRQTRR